MVLMYIFFRLLAQFLSFTIFLLSSFFLLVGIVGLGSLD